MTTPKQESWEERLREGMKILPPHIYSIFDEQLIPLIRTEISAAELRGRQEAVSKGEMLLLSDLRDICVEEDLLDLQAYDSISRGDKINNAWKALEVIEKLTQHQ